MTHEKNRTEKAEYEEKKTSNSLNELMSMPLIRIILRLKAVVNRFGRRIGSKRHFFLFLSRFRALTRAHLTLRLCNIGIGLRVSVGVFFPSSFYFVIIIYNSTKAVSLLSFRIPCQIFFFHYLFIEIEA